MAYLSDIEIAQSVKMEPISKIAKKIKVKGAKNDEYEIKKLTAKKTYYVRIRAWKKAKGKMYYSAWSKTLSKKVK